MRLIRNQICAHTSKKNSYSGEEVQERSGQAKEKARHLDAYAPLQTDKRDHHTSPQASTVKDKSSMS